MSLCSHAQSTKIGCISHHNALPTITNVDCDEGISKPEEEEDEDEDEDVDFNPFLKETLSPEASSSLSSEVEGLDGDTIDRGHVRVSASKHTSEKQKGERESEQGEEVVMQTAFSSAASCEKEIEKIEVSHAKKKTSALVHEPRSEAVRGKDNNSGSGTDVNDVVDKELVNTIDSWKPVTDLETEDAICTRTRARYSLASFTLDELETFLQETDDEDDLQNVDDEEEYRKFLAAVLHGGDGDGHPTQENETVDDDEDNDADFEIELEEALESDNDENVGDINEGEREKGGRRPETRQNRRQKANAQNKKKLSTQTKRPLRPLLPVLPNVPIPSLSTQIVKMPETALQDGYINGFTQHQIGQLHCLIHEHVQLLIQVFCLCVLDSSRQHIASQVQKLILEMLHKCNEVLSWRTVSYPSTCFCPAYLCSSASNDVPKLFPMQCTLESPPRNPTDDVCSANNEAAASQKINLLRGRSECASNGHAGSFPNMEGLFWVPYVNGLLVTILDVAPLSLVGKFMDDVETAVQESRRCHVETGCDSRLEKEPLFPLSGFPPVPQAHSEVSSSPGQQPQKKTLAATIVESTKKQSIALVPRDITKLSQRFFPLFNPALFPHKAPPSAVSNRVLFTDSEDELLALGMIEYNTNWKAIQERFLPCKSKHQIFVRQKNRCSSKAPENPIKAVRRMKTSPLTAEEMARIQEGLKIFKYDWMSVWQFSVPHRDPSLLPRQWRTALGTQKSYKLDAEKREKRRLYELSRRKCKSSATTSWQDKTDSQVESTGGDNNNADACIDNSGKTFVHEAFLADWRPSDPSGYSSSDIARNPHNGMLYHEQRHNHDYGKAPQPIGGYMQQFPSMSKFQHPSFHCAGVGHFGANSSAPNTTSSTSKSQFYLRPYRARRSNGTNLVRLAPDLPPVNLPPSVRVVSLRGASTPVSAAGGVTGDTEKENLVSRIPHAIRSGITHITKSGENKSNAPNDHSTSLRSDESRIIKAKCVDNDGNTDSDLQMHPLLFQATEDGRIPYYPLNCGTSDSSSFSFFSGNQPQLHLSLLHNPHQENLVGSFTKSLQLKDSTSLSCGIDFHPLLQRMDYAQGDSIDDQTESLVNGDPLSTGKLVEKANELDLDIHISSSSRKESSWGREEATQNPVGSTTNVPDSGVSTKTQNSNRSLYPYNESSPSNISRPVSGGHSLVLAGDNIDRYVDDLGDQSHPEIVMEQEELSDSDEENEESVEFECEEMTDSEGDEGSGCEQINEIQIEERPSSAVEKLNAANGEDKTCESRTTIRSQDAVPILGKNIPSLELGLTSQGKDDDGNSSWLSLDSSSARHCPARLTENEHEDTAIREGPAAKRLASSRPSRSCKKKNLSMDGVIEQRQTLDGKQLNLAPLRIPILRKPRKRARGSSGLNIELDVNNANCNDEDKVS